MQSKVFANLSVMHEVNETSITFSNNLLMVYKSFSDHISLPGTCILGGFFEYILYFGLW